jgi:hypothetical protein
MIRHLARDGVAGLVPALVVDALERVDVQHRAEGQAVRRLRSSSAFSRVEHAHHRVDRDRVGVRSRFPRRHRR